MLNKLLSGDYPRSRVLSVMLGAVFFILAFMPFIIEVFGIESGRQLAMDSAVKICIFILLAASYDMLLGYTAVISFAHTVFFAIGAYSVGIMLNHTGAEGVASGASWIALVGAIILGIICSATLALIIALVGLRVRTLFFTMITLAVAAGFLFLLVKLSTWTGGLDGLNFDEGIPALLAKKFLFLPSEGADVSLSGIRYISYYLIFLVSAVVFWFMLRMVNSPLGRVLQAIRENEFRTLAIGFKPVFYKIIVIVLACSIASLAGSLYAIWLRSAVPNSYLTLNIMIVVLIMVVVGGMGTIYGAVIGAVIMTLMENYLRTGLNNIIGDGIDIPVVHELIHADRWLMYLGIMYVLCVYFFNIGVVGKLRVLAAEKLLKKMKS